MKFASMVFSTVAALTWIVFAAAAPLHGVSQARLLGTVVDGEGSPVPGVEVSLVSEAGSTDLSAETDEDGKFSLLVVEATHPPYFLRLEKEGYQVVSGPVELAPGETIRREFAMPRLAAGARTAPSADEEAVSLFNEAAALYNAADEAAAVPKFEAALEADPGLVDAYRSLTEIHLSRGEHDRALEVTDRWLQQEPESQEVELLRYDALVGAGRTEEAEDLIQGLLRSAPGPELAPRLYNLGATASREGDDEQAIEWLEKAVEVDPELLEAWSALASVRLSAGNAEAAIAAADEVLTARPDDPEALTVQYEAYKSLDRQEEAEEVLDRMESVADDPQVLYRRGVAQFNASNYEQAITSLRRAIELDPELARAHFTLGLALLNQDHSAGARKHLRRFLELAPDDPDTETARGVLDHLRQR